MATDLLLAARDLRTVGDGLVSQLLPVYLLQVGYGPCGTGISRPPHLPDPRFSPCFVAFAPTVPRGRTLLMGAPVEDADRHHLR
jgi:hypothetical protein